MADDLIWDGMCWMDLWGMMDYGGLKYEVSRREILIRNGVTRRRLMG